MAHMSIKEKSFVKIELQKTENQAFAKFRYIEKPTIEYVFLMFMYVLIFSASQLPYQPGVHQSYSGSLVNGITQQQQSLTKHYPSGNGVVGASMPQHGVVTMGERGWEG